MGWGFEVGGGNGFGGGDEVRSWWDMNDVNAEGNMQGKISDNCNSCSSCFFGT